MRRGDTVQSVADNFGVPASMVRRWNHLRGESLGGRRVVYVHLPITPNSHEILRTASAKHKSSNKLSASNHKIVVHHKVARGETLTSIASTHHTTVQALKRDNDNVATLRPGMILVIRGAH